MRFQYLVCALMCVLLAGLAYAQTAPPASPPAAGATAEPGAPSVPDKAPEVKVGPDDVVITLKGFCTDSKLTGPACQTTITRAQFEKLAEALQPNMSSPLRRQLATRYSMGLKMATEAEKRGLDKQPSFEEKIYFARLQILSQELSSALQADSGKVSDEDIKEYYNKNLPGYEQATFNRIIVPRTKQLTTPAASTKPGEKATPPPAPTEEQKKDAEEAMTKLADSLRARAAKGDDPDKLQKEAYVAAGLNGNTVNTKLEKQRRNSLPPTHQVVMDLKSGEVSQVISDPNSGHYIYIMVSKETLSLESVTPDVRKLISSQRYRDGMQSFQNDVDLNDAYFGPARNPGVPLPPKGRPLPDHAPDKD
jgi:hypothetical protein